MYDIWWHRLNVLRERAREEEAEARGIVRETEAERREIERERLAEERQMRREQQEILRKHWQELQSDLIRLNTFGTQVHQFREFVKKNNDSEDPTVRLLLSTMSARFPGVLSDFGQYWGRAVAQLNVFPHPRDVLALEVLEVVQELGKSLGNSSVEIKDETLKKLAELVPKVASRATIPNAGS